jgi:hypothetical protein
VLSQSDGVILAVVSRENVQSKKRLLQAGAYKKHVPLGFVKSFHGCVEGVEEGKKSSGRTWVPTREIFGSVVMTKRAHSENFHGATRRTFQTSRSLRTTHSFGLSGMPRVFIVS